MNIKAKRVTDKQQRIDRRDHALGLYKQGYTYQKIGDLYNISRERVRKILNTSPEFITYTEEYKKAMEINDYLKEDGLKLKAHEKSFMTRFPEQTKEFWDYDKNELKPENVAAGSTAVEVWLKCPIDDYSWKKTPNNIIYMWLKGNRGCPCCAGRTKKYVKRTSLMDAYPEFVKQYWDYEKNTDLNPEIITSGSNFKAWFKCPHDGHEWEALIGSTVIQQWSKENAGCKACNTKSRVALRLEKAGAPVEKRSYIRKKAE